MVTCDLSVCAPVHPSHVAHYAIIKGSVVHALQVGSIISCGSLAHLCCAHVVDYPALLYSGFLKAETIVEVHVFRAWPWRLFYLLWTLMA